MIFAHAIAIGIWESFGAANGSTFCWRQGKGCRDTNRQMSKNLLPIVDPEAEEAHVSS